MVTYLTGNRIRGTSAERNELGIVLDDLKAYWKFNETSPNDIVNQAATVGSTDGLPVPASNLQVTGATYNVAISPFGYSMTFDGNNDKAIAGTSLTQFNFFQNGSSPKWTICWWGRAPNTDGDGIIGTRPNNGAGGLTIRTRTGGSFSTQVDNGGGLFLAADGQTGYGDGTIKFFVVQFDYSLASSNLLQLADNTDTYNFNKSSTTMSDENAANALTIGVQSDGADFTNMSMCECSIWNRILTTDEITQLYNSGNGVELTNIKVQDGSIFYETDTNKEYVLYNNTWTEV
jgi:hypothetical protein